MRGVRGGQGQGQGGSSKKVENRRRQREFRRLGKNIILTVTGTSIEMGDDGATGRGNRGNGLITPMRPMTMEAIAGKNPVSHVGKIYNVLAERMAKEIAELEGVEEAYVTLVSKIGSPIRQPLLRGVRICGDVRA